MKPHKFSWFVIILGIIIIGISSWKWMPTARADYSQLLLGMLHGIQFIFFGIMIEIARVFLNEIEQEKERQKFLHQRSDNLFKDYIAVRKAMMKLKVGGIKWSQKNVRTAGR